MLNTHLIGISEKENIENGRHEKERGIFLHPKFLNRQVVRVPSYGYILMEFLLLRKKSLIIQSPGKLWKVQIHRPHSKIWGFI